MSVELAKVSDSDGWRNENAVRAFEAVRVARELGFPVSVEYSVELTPAKPATESTRAVEAKREQFLTFTAEAEGES
jgi:hypothetical protein